MITNEPECCEYTITSFLSAVKMKLVCMAFGVFMVWFLSLMTAIRPVNDSWSTWPSSYLFKEGLGYSHSTDV
jgi:hypothetical protein